MKHNENQTLRVLHNHALLDITLNVRDTIALFLHHIINSITYVTMVSSVCTSVFGGQQVRGSPLTTGDVQVFAENLDGRGFTAA